MMTEKEIIQELVKEDSIPSRPQLQRRFGISDAKSRQIYFAVKMVKENVIDVPKESEQAKIHKPEPEQKSKSIGISEEELRRKHDNRFIISEQVKKLNRDNFLTTPEFIQLCRVRTNNGYKQLLEHPEFEQYQGRAGGVTYWSHPESIDKLKKEGVLT